MTFGINIICECGLSNEVCSYVMNSMQTTGNVILAVHFTVKAFNTTNDMEYFSSLKVNETSGNKAFKRRLAYFILLQYL